MAHAIHLSRHIIMPWHVTVPSVAAYSFPFGAPLRDVFRTAFPAPLISRLLSVGTLSVLLLPIFAFSLLLVVHAKQIMFKSYTVPIQKSRGFVALCQEKIHPIRLADLLFPESVSPRFYEISLFRKMFS